MKKSILLLLALTAFFAAQAQWTNSPTNNNFLANTSADAGEILLSTDEVSGDTYVQWTSFYSNGWSPTLQRLTYNGIPQWGETGTHISAPAFATWSQGIAMTATNDGGVVSCFATDAGQTYAVRINADGTFPWGPQGVLLFGGLGDSRTELLAGNDGGVWALGTDITNSYLQYVNADGTLNPLITISDSGKNCTFGQLVPAANNGVFLVYEKEEYQYTYFYSKELWVRGYNLDGTPFSEDTKLMNEKIMIGAYIHYVVPDGLGGGYAYLWHADALGQTYNVYVFHFNANGANTIPDLNGVTVHSIDPYNFYLDAYGTVDPTSHDLLVVFRQTDVQYQAECKIFVNRITSSGQVLWGEGMLVLDNGTTPCGGLRIDAFEYEPGFSVIYHKGSDQTGVNSTIEAQGFNMDGEHLWTTTMCSSPYSKTGDKNSTGFHLGQNIIAWVNSSTGGLYGQNIGTNGTMGPMIPPTPPTPCYPPENFDGKYSYDHGTHTFGTSLQWDAPEELPLNYFLYRKNLVTGNEFKISIDPNLTNYFDEVEMGDYQYQLTAVHMDCESDPALTINGENYLFIEVTSVDENSDEAIVTVTKVYTLQGQLIKNVYLEDLSHGIYIVQGLTSSGNLVNRKVVVE